MSQARPVVPEPITPPPVEGITGVWRFSREPGGHHRARSLPGHLLHLVLEGSYRLRTNGREYDIKPRDVIYYHETEEVEWLGNAGRVTFYSVGFLASALEPLPAERRVFPSSKPIRAAFDRLHAAALLPRDARRTLGIYAALLAVLAEIDWWPRPAPEAAAEGADLWWRLERLLREKRRFRSTIDELAAEAGCSRASVVRACRAATGASPMRRLRDVRMAEARGLLGFSTLNVGQVAAYLGYPRIHEFSREFLGCCGHPPSAARRPAKVAVPKAAPKKKTGGSSRKPPVV
jgi:AraC-like DNA-binding protein